jgi:hypothetical protein
MDGLDDVSDMEEVEDLGVEDSGVAQAGGSLSLGGRVKVIAAAAKVISLHRSVKEQQRQSTIVKERQRRRHLEHQAI